MQQLPSSRRCAPSIVLENNSPEGRRLRAAVRGCASANLSTAAVQQLSMVNVYPLHEGAGMERGELRSLPLRTSRWLRRS